MIPAPMELPRDTATPKPTPSTRRSAPLGAGIVRKTMCAQRDYRRPPPKAQQLWLSPPVDFPPMFLTSSKQTKNKVKFANSNGVRIGHVMPHAMAVLHGVIAKDGGLVCDSEPLSCPRCGAVYDLHYSNETGPSQLQLFRYIASENICNEHPRPQNIDSRLRYADHIDGSRKALFERHTQGLYTQTWCTRPLFDGHL